MQDFMAQFLVAAPNMPPNMVGGNLPRGNSLRQDFDTYFWPAIRPQLNSNNAYHLNQAQTGTRDRFVAEQAGTTWNALRENQTSLIQRYAGVARGFLRTAEQADQGGVSDETAAARLYDSIYTTLRGQGVDDQRARGAASAAKNTYMARRQAGDMPATAAIAGAQAARAYLESGTTNMPTPTPTPTPGPTPLPIPGGGGLDLPPLPDGGSFPVPSPDGGGGGMVTLPPLDGMGMPTAGASTTKFDPSTLIGGISVPEWFALLPWGEIMEFLRGEDGEGVLGWILGALFGRQPSNVKNCGALTDQYIQDYPEFARAIALWQCGVSAPIGLTKNGEAMFIGLQLVMSGATFEPHSCGCGPTVSRSANRRPGASGGRGTRR